MWLFVGESHPTKKIPNLRDRKFTEYRNIKNPGDKISKLRKIPRLEKPRIPGIKIPRLKEKIPDFGDLSKKKIRSGPK